MLKSNKARFWLLGVGIVLAATVVVAAVQTVPPLRVLARFPLATLAAESTIMDDCARCHEPAAFHTCETCHDDHGAVVVANVPLNNLLLLTGDVPEPRYLAVNELLPQREQAGTHMALLDLLAQQGVEDFHSVALASSDGGLVTIERANLTREALLLPYTDSVRFAAEDLHVSSWLKGISRIIVVGKETPLRIDGQETSIGRLLLGPVVSVTVEQTDVMLKSETDGQVRKAKTAARQEGVLVRDVVANPGLTALQVRNAKGQAYDISGADLSGALLALIRGEVTLVLPERGRSQWVAGVVEITSQR